MGFRFQKRIKLLPGITLNVSKSGLSTSVGPRGARVTMGHGKTRVTTGLPGTGISHTSITTNQPQASAGSSGLPTWQIVLVCILLAIIAAKLLL